MARRADEFDPPGSSDDEALFQCFLGMSVEEATHSVSQEAFRLTHNRYRAEDLGQDAILRVFRWLRAGRSSVPIENAHGWLRSVVLRQWISNDRDGRRQKRGGGAVDERLEDTLPLGGQHGEPQAALLRRERQRSVRRAISTLPPEQQAVVVRAALGYPLSEIAVILGVPLGTVKSRTSAAYKRLRVKLRPDA